MSAHEARTALPDPHSARGRVAAPAAGLIAAYREGLGLAAVMLVRGAAKIRISAPASLGAGALAEGETAHVWWCRRRADAERLAAAAARQWQRRAQRQQESSASPQAVADAAAAIEKAAERLGIRVWPDEEIAAEAVGLIASVEEQLEHLRRGGQLRAVNRSYRTHRMQAAARGEKTPTYAAWFADYKADLVRRLAKALRDNS